MTEHPETYEEALEQAVEVQKELNEEKKTRRKKATPPKATVSDATERARARVREKLGK